MSDMCPYGWNGPILTHGDHCYHQANNDQYCCWCDRRFSVAGGDIVSANTIKRCAKLKEHGSHLRGA